VSQDVANTENRTITEMCLRACESPAATVGPGGCLKVSGGAPMGRSTVVTTWRVQETLVHDR
jgi:hypothetical protein